MKPRGAGFAGGFAAALRSEVFIELRGRKIWLIALLPAAAALVSAALRRLRLGAETARGALAGAPAGAAENAYGPFADALSTALTIAVLAFVALAAHGLARDRELGTARSLLTRRAGRGELVVARYLLLNAAALAAVALAAACAWGAAALFHDFGPAVVDGFEVFSAAEVRGEVLYGLGMAAIPLPAAIAFGMLVSACARSAAGAVGAALGLTLAFDLLKGLLGDAALWVYACHHPALSDRSYLQEAARIARGFSDVFVPQETLILNAAVPLPQAALLLGLAVAVALRRRM